MRTPISVGVIGVGALGLELAEIFDELPQSELRCLCDSRPDVQLRTPRRFPDVICRDPGDVLDDEAIDAVVLAMPSPGREPLLRRALLAGKHVLVRGPLAYDSAEADELVGLAESLERRLVVENAALFQPELRKLKDFVRLERLGELFYVKATHTEPTDLSHPESVVWTLGPRPVSLVLFLLDDEPVEVVARGDAFMQGETDVAFCHLRFATGIVAQLHLSRLDRRRTRQIAVVGSKRMAVHDELDPDRPLSVDQSRLAIGTNGIPALRIGDLVFPRGVPGRPIRLQCEHFLATIRAPADPSPARRDAAVVHTLEALDRSVRAAGAPMAVGDTAPRDGRVVHLSSRAR